MSLTIAIYGIGVENPSYKKSAAKGLHIIAGEGEERAHEEDHVEEKQ